MANSYLWSDLFKKRASDKDFLTESLSKNILFASLTKSELSVISRVVYQRVYQPGEVIFHQNSRGFGMYIIARGEVAIRTESAHGKSLLTNLEKGNFFGELALIENNNIRTASAVAEERCELIGFFKPDLMDILETKPVIGVKILYALGSVLGQRLMETTERLGILAQTKGISDSHDRYL